MSVSLQASSLGHDLAQAALTSKPLFTGNGSAEKVSLAQGGLTSHSLCFLLCARAMLSKGLVLERADWSCGKERI